MTAGLADIGSDLQQFEPQGADFGRSQFHAPEVPHSSKKGSKTSAEPITDPQTLSFWGLTPLLLKKPFQ